MVLALMGWNPFFPETNVVSVGVRSLIVCIFALLLLVALVLWTSGRE